MAMCSVSVTRPSSSSIALPSSSFSSSSLFLQRPSHAVVAIPLKQLRNSRLASTHKKPGSRLECVAAAAAFEEGRRSTDYFDEGPQETEEEITKAYEALYGPKFGGLSKDRRWDSSTDGGDEDGAGKAGKGRRGRGGSDDGMGRPSRRGAKDNLEERVVQIRRVTKVVKGGKQLSFRAIVVVGDKKGRVGVGVGKAKEVVAAVQKSGVDARRHMANVPMTKYRTFPHRADGKYGAAKVMLRPAAPGTGVIAGGSVRVVLELAGVENALGKELGSQNPLNNARAVVDAVSKMKQFKDVAEKRGIPMEELWK